LKDATQVQVALQRIRSGNRETAVTEIRKLVDCDAKLADLWMSVAQVALSIGELTLAESCARKFLQVNKAQTRRALYCAGVLAEAGRFAKALDLIRPLLNKSPDDPSLNHLCGTVYQQLGEQRLAATHLQKTLKSAELAGISWLTLAAQHRFSADDPLLKRLIDLRHAFSSSDNVNRLQYQYALGKALLDIQEYDQAFDAFSAGAELAPDAKLYDRRRESEQVDSIIAGNDARSLAAITSPDIDSSRALFVIGMPRSGTTLLQRILTAHKTVADGGEFSSMGVATMDLRRQSLASCASLSRRLDAGAADLANLTRIYAHLMTERFGANGTIVDKSINNSYYVGLIAKAFPTAPIVVVQRNIIDVAWSCFRTCFSKGMIWSWSLDDIAAHLRAETRLLNHWKETLSDRLIIVQYEELVREPQRQLPRLLVECGLDADDNIINFYRQQSPVLTASVAQVNQPLNDKAIGSAKQVIHRMQTFLDAYDVHQSVDPGHTEI